MLVVPVAEKFTWKNPPYVTLFLVIVNIIIFAGFQGNDNEQWEKAATFFFKSGLADIEIPLFLEFKESEKNPITVPEQFKRSQRDSDYYIFFQMEQDDTFQKMLKNNRIVTTDSPDYAKWKDLRNQFQSLKDRIFSNKYQFVPAEHKPFTFISHMFLHGGFEHLFGNMLFLWLFGCILEMGCGRGKYLLMYIVTGIGAVSLFWACQPGAGTGLIGASGAISGLMGAYTVLFGKSRIKLFLYLGFYFNYIRFPAIALLPFWLAREFYSLFLGPETNVAYTAHIGGIISGTVAGLIILKFSDFNKDEVFKEEKQDKSIPLVEEALACIGKLDFEKGKALLEQAIVENKRNYPAYAHIYHIEKQNPETDAFHAIARKYLISLCADDAAHEQVFRLYSEYRKLGKPRLTPELYMTLSIIFSREGRVHEAEEIIEMILKRKPDLPRMPTAILKLSDAFKRKRIEEKALKFLDILCTRYPETPEAILALKEMKKRI